MRLQHWIIALMLAAAGGVAASAQESNSARPRRVLLLGQKPDSHPATTHEYMAGVGILGKLLSKQLGIQTILVQADSPWRDGPELLDGADAAVLFLTEGARWVSDDLDRLAAFQRLAARRGGLSVLHWGMGTREAEPIKNFTELFGACHGGPDRKYKVATLTVRPDSVQHPVLTGIDPFEARDEFYYELKLPTITGGGPVAPLVRVPIDGVDQMVAWAWERPDQGRSFGFSGLHFHDNWKLTEYRRLVLQGVLWTLRQSIPQTGLAVDLPKEDLALPVPKPSAS